MGRRGSVYTVEIGKHCQLPFFPFVSHALKWRTLVKSADLGLAGVAR